MQSDLQTSNQNIMLKKLNYGILTYDRHIFNRALLNISIPVFSVDFEREAGVFRGKIVVEIDKVVNSLHSIVLHRLAHHLVAVDFWRFLDITVKIPCEIVLCIIIYLNILFEKFCRLCKISS